MLWNKWRKEALIFFKRNEFSPLLVFPLRFLHFKDAKNMSFFTKSLLYIWYVFTVRFRSVKDAGATEELMRISGSCVQGLCPTCWFLTLLFGI